MLYKLNCRHIHSADNNNTLSIYLYIIYIFNFLKNLTNLIRVGSHEKHGSVRKKKNFQLFFFLNRTIKMVRLGGSHGSGWKNEKKKFSTAVSGTKLRNQTWYRSFYDGIFHKCLNILYLYIFNELLKFWYLDNILHTFIWFFEKKSIKQKLKFGSQMKMYYFDHLQFQRFKSNNFYKSYHFFVSCVK